MDVVGEYHPLQADDVQEIYALEEVAKTVAHIGSSLFVTCEFKSIVIPTIPMYNL